MAYIAKAYVKIPRERTQDLILELCRLDYKNSAYHPCDIFWFIEDGYFYSMEYTTKLEESESIDCNAYTPNGTEEEAVKLFLELAQMEDEISIKARVVVGETDGSLRLQTPLEVAEAFRDGRIEL